MALPWNAWLNIETDTVTKSQIQLMYPMFTDGLPFEPWYMCIKTKKIVNIPKGPLDGIQWPTSTTILEHQIPNPWRVFNGCNGKSSAREHSSKTQVSKHITGHFSHGENMVWHGQQSMATCPCCQAVVEDKLHMLQCPAPNAHQKLRLWLKEHGTELQLHDVLLTHLESWANSTQDQGDRSSPPFIDA